MTRKVGYPLNGGPAAKGGGADSGVVDSGSALYPTALRALSLSRLLTCRSRRHMTEETGGQEGGSGAGVGGRKRGGAAGARGMSDRCGAPDVALRA